MGLGRTRRRPQRFEAGKIALEPIHAGRQEGDGCRDADLDRARRELDDLCGVGHVVLPLELRERRPELFRVAVVEVVVCPREVGPHGLEGLEVFVGRHRTFATRRDEERDHEQSADDHQVLTVPTQGRYPCDPSRSPFSPRRVRLPSGRDPALGAGAGLRLGPELSAIEVRVEAIDGHQFGV